MSTAGDLDRDTPLERFGRPAVFSRELDEALLDGRIDLAVHSLKDLPVDLPGGISLAAVSAREDPRDALIGRGPIRWTDLPQGAVVATSSLRRHAQLLRARPDLQVVELRGNVGTRIDQLDRTPSWSAILLATAGLVRLGLGHRIGERLDPELMLPAPGQGALAVTIRAGDTALRHAIEAAVNDRPTALAVTAERALLGALEGGCHVPVAALGTAGAGAEPELRLTARVLSLDGREAIDDSVRRSTTSIEQAAAVGVEIARRLLDDGADRILAGARRQAALEPR